MTVTGSGFSEKSKFYVNNDGNMCQIISVTASEAVLKLAAFDNGGTRNLKVLENEVEAACTGCLIY